MRSWPSRALPSLIAFFLAYGVLETPSAAADQSGNSLAKEIERLEADLRKLRQNHNKALQDIEKRLGKPITTFSYPNGLADDFDKEIINIVKESGFICAVTAIPKMVTSGTDLYELGRLPPGWSYDTFKFFISGLYSSCAFNQKMKG